MRSTTAPWRWRRPSLAAAPLGAGVAPEPPRHRHPDHHQVAARRAHGADAGLHVGGLRRVQAAPAPKSGRPSTGSPESAATSLHRQEPAMPDVMPDATPEEHELPLHHLGRRPRAWSPRTSGSASCRRRLRDRGPKVSREKVKLEFEGGHYGFERDADDGQWCDVWLFDDLVVPTGLLHAPAGIPRDEQRNVAADLRGLPPRHLRPDRAARRHGRSTTSRRPSTTRTSSRASPARASPSATTRTSRSRACASTTTG